MKRWRICFILVGITLALVWARRTDAFPLQPTRDMTVMGQLGGTVKNVVSDGRFAYAIVGPRILTFDLTDPAFPVLIAQTPPLEWADDDYLNNLQIDSGRLYAISGQTLQVFQPHEDGTLSEPTAIDFPGYPNIVHEGVVYLSDTYPTSVARHLSFWDISNPQQPRFLGDYENDWMIQGFKVANQRMYLVNTHPMDNENPILAIFDITQPGQPQYIGHLAIPYDGSSFQDLRVAGTYLYYLTSSHLYVLDLHDETHPHMLGKLDVSGNRIAAVSNGGVILEGYINLLEHLLFIDVSNPSHPIYVGAQPAPGLKASWEAQGLLITANAEYGLQTFSLAEGLEPKPLGSYQPELRSPSGVITAHNTAYVLDAADLAVVDITDPAQPHIEQRIELPESGTALHVYGRYLYIGAGKHLVIYDIQSPLAPKPLNAFTLPDTVTDIATLPDRLYVSAGDLYVLDTKGNTLPRAIIEKPGNCIDAATTQGKRYLYIVSQQLTIYDVTDENAIQKMGALDLAHTISEPEVTDIHVRRDLAYLSTGEIIDIGDPTNPQWIQPLNYGGVPYAHPAHPLGQTALWGSRHYLINAVINVSDPKLPYREQTYPPLPHIASLAMNENGMLVMAAAEQGLWFLQSRPYRVENRFWEAEDGNVIPPLHIEEGTGACGGHDVAAPIPEDGRIDFTLDIEVGDDYYLWARVMGQDWYHNSFWVRFDEGTFTHFEIRPPDGQWHWIRVYPEGEPPEPVFLSAGTHTLQFGGRETGSRVDALFLSNYPNLHPDDQAPCQLPSVPPDTPTPPPPRPAPTPIPTPASPPNIHLTHLANFNSDPFFHFTSPVTAQEDNLFVAQDNRLFIYDTHPLPKSVRLTATLPLPGPIQSLGIHENYLFAQAQGLVVIDISDIHNPRIVAHLPHPASGEIHIDSDRLYLVDGQTWTVIDIQHPASPIWLATLHMPAGQRIRFENHRAFIQETGNIVGIYDLNSLAQVEKEAAFVLPTGNDYIYATIRDMLVHEQRLYLLTNSRESATGLGITASMMVVDVPPHQPPTLRGTFQLEGWIRGTLYEFSGLIRAGEDLIVGYSQRDGDSDRSYYALWRFDVSDPDHPLPVQKQEVDNKVVPILATDSRVWVKFGSRLATFTATDLIPLTITGDLAMQSVGGTSTHAFVWDGKRLHFVNNVDPKAPFEQAIYQNGFEALSVSFQRHRAFIGRHAGALTPYDIPNQICQANLILGPGAPCHYLPVESEEAIHVLPDPYGYAFLVTTMERYPQPPRTETFIVNVQDEEAMQVEGSVTIAPDAAAIVPGQTKYIVWAKNEDPFTSHITIARLTTPDVTESELSVPGPIRAIAVDGNTLLILTDKALQTVDLTTPEAPRPLTVWRLEGAQGRAHAMRMSSGRAYVTIGRQLRVVDVTNPAHPFEVGVYNAPDEALDLYIQPPLVLLAASRAGMINLQMEWPIPVLYLPLVHH